MIGSSFLLFLLAASPIPVTPTVDGGEPGDAEPAGAPSVVSINLCADQLVLELADAAQIRAVSTLARDPRGSVHHERAADHATVSGRGAEELIPLAPDIVVTGPYTSRHTLALLAELGVRVETLPIADSIAAMRANVLAMGEWLGQAPRAQALVADIDARLSRLADASGKPGEEGEEGVPNDIADRPLAALYDANGYTAGATTLRGELLALAGWRNLATEVGIDSYGKLALESLVARAPDALIESPFGAGVYSRGQALTRHPALRASGLDPLLVSIPSALTICAGPWSVGFAERLVVARESLAHRRPPGRTAPPF